MPRKRQVADLKKRGVSEREKNMTGTSMAPTLRHFVDHSSQEKKEKTIPYLPMYKLQWQVQIFFSISGV